MRLCLCVAAVLIGWAGAALAADAGAPTAGLARAAQPGAPPDPATQKPCTRGASHITLGGVDFDVTRCETFQLMQAVSNQQIEIIQLTAQIELLKNDLEAARAAKDAAPTPAATPKPKEP